MTDRFHLLYLQKDYVGINEVEREIVDGMPSPPQKCYSITAQYTMSNLYVMYQNVPTRGNYEARHGACP